MCDYSLMNLPNRLANEGEILVTHKFSSGSVGFVALQELCAHRNQSESKPTGLWSTIKVWFSGPPVVPGLAAVCIPPGARLQVVSVSLRGDKGLGAQPDDELTFTQLSASWNQFRDALRHRNGREVLLQNVGTGLQVQIVSLASAEELESHAEYVNGVPLRR